MKIGMLTLNFQVFTINYGCILQSYALWRALADLGHSPEIIDYDSSSRRWMNPRHPYKTLPPCEMKTLYFLNRCGGVRKWRDARRFLEDNAKVTERVYKTENFNASDYDVYTVGSDTIWDIRQMHGFEPAFFADFACIKKAIAYAPSFGEAVYTPEEAAHFQALLSKFAGLSVREDLNRDAFGVYAGRVETVLDPTMLYDAKHYSKYAKAPDITEKYLLYYVVYNAKADVTRRVDEYAKARGLTVVEISPFSQNAHPVFFRLLNGLLRRLPIGFLRRVLRKFHIYAKVPSYGGGSLRHVMRYGAGVGEFLGWIEHAELVVTNSFHGSAFSIVFGKRFYNFTRAEASQKQKWICALLGIEDRCLSDNVQLDDAPIDYEGCVFPRLDELRRKSWAFLKRSLDTASERC